MLSAAHLLCDIPSVLMVSELMNRGHFILGVCTSTSLVVSFARWYFEGDENKSTKEMKMIGRVCDVTSVAYTLALQVMKKKVSLECVVSSLLFCYVSCRGKFFSSSGERKSIKRIYRRFFYSLSRFCFNWCFLNYLTCAQ